MPSPPSAMTTSESSTWTRRGGNVVISTREEWEAWFHGLFANLDAMGAETGTSR